MEPTGVERHRRSPKGERAGASESKRSVLAGGNNVGGFGNGEAVALGVGTDCLFDGWLKPNRIYRPRLASRRVRIG